jgi:AcrR family transcriptional regulator
VTSIPPAADDAYHHGNLPNALRAAAVEVIIENGVGGFSLREVARRAGVSHAAPGYHFGDVRGLLTSVAVEGFETLHRALLDAGTGIEDPIERLHSIGLAYVRVGVEHPGHCQVIFRNDLIEANDEHVQHAGLGAYGVLESTIAEIDAVYGLAMPVTDSAELCWSAMQGLVELQSKFEHLDALRGDAATTIEERSARFSRMLIGGLLATPGTGPR